MLTLNELKERIAERGPGYPPHLFRAWMSEISAADWLATQGYRDFMMAGGVGVDITARNSFGSIRTFDVKMAYRSSGGYWHVSKVSFNHRSDDYVLIVLPNKHVVQEHMEHHLACVGRGGIRTVTDLVRRFDPASFEKYRRPRVSRRRLLLEPRPAWTGLPPLVTWRPNRENTYGT